MVTINVASRPGKGINFATIGSVYKARGGAVTLGECYMVAEDIDAPDDAAVTVENSGADNGTLANTVPVSTAVADGLKAAVGDLLGVIVLAEESAVEGGVYRALIEGYYVDAKVTTASARAPRLALFLNSSTSTSVLEDTLGTNRGAPVFGRLLEQVAGSQTGVLTKVHFCGVPGGFGVGAGA